VMLIGQLPGVVAGIAGVAAIAHYADYRDTMRVAAPLLLGAVLDVLLIFTGLFLAWDQLAPKRSPRMKLRDRLLAGFLLGIPTFAGIIQIALPEPYTAREEALIAMFLQAGAVAILAMLIGVTTSDRLHNEGRAPWKQAVLCGLLTMTGIFIARAIPLGETLPSLQSATWLSTIYLALYAFFIGASAAAFARFVQTPALRIALAIGFHVALFIGSIVAHEAHRLIGIDRNAFMWMNPVGVVEAIERTRHDYVGLGFGFVLAGIAVSLLIAARRR
jgi:hypothetical protein